MEESHIGKSSESNKKRTWTVLIVISWLPAIILPWSFSSKSLQNLGSPFFPQKIQFTLYFFLIPQAKPAPLLLVQGGCHHHQPPPWWSMLFATCPCGLFLVERGPHSFKVLPALPGCEKKSLGSRRVHKKFSFFKLKNIWKDFPTFQINFILNFHISPPYAFYAIILN